MEVKMSKGPVSSEKNKGITQIFAKSPYLIGGASRDRTDDLLNAIQALSQLSYNPIFLFRKCLKLIPVFRRCVN